MALHGHVACDRSSSVMSGKVEPGRIAALLYRASHAEVHPQTPLQRVQHDVGERPNLLSYVAQRRPYQVTYPAR